MKKIYLYSVFLFMTAGVLMVSCKKDKPEPAPAPVPADTDSQSATDNSMAEAEFSQVVADVNNIGINEEGIQKQGSYSCDTNNVGHGTGLGLGGCVTATVTPCWSDTATWPKTVIWDFGTVGCLGWDGRFRKGTITVQFSAPWRNEGAVATVTLQNYYVYHFYLGGYLLHTGSVILTNLTPGGIDTSLSANIPKINIRVNDAPGMSGYATIQTTPNAIQWKSDRTYEQIAGHTTASDVMDDIVTLYGSGSGINRKGQNFDVTVLQTTKIRKAASCQWVEDGIITVDPTSPDLQPRTINFGYPNGNCDSLATFQIGSGNPIEFIMQ